MMTAPALSDPIGNERASFMRDVIRGLGGPKKSLLPQYFYDRRGCELFDQICHLDEYYVPRRESAILANALDPLRESLPTVRRVVELGAPSAGRTGNLLRALPGLIQYVPVNVARAALDAARQICGKARPDIDVRRLAGDFTDQRILQSSIDRELSTLVFFPGTTIGNFSKAQAEDFLCDCRRAGCDFMLVGVDYIKPVEVLLPAYDDKQGVTAAFNLNLLTRINAELGGDFRLERFRHRAYFNVAESRVEMHLESLEPQGVRIAGREFRFGEGETIHTESSYKYSTASFTALARAAGFAVADVWSDDEQSYGLFLLCVPH